MGGWLNYRSMLTGRVCAMSVGEPILIKHLLKTSGIEYDLFPKNFFFGGCLRQSSQPTKDVYRSSNIVGAALTLEQFVDTIGRAGVLT